MERREADVPLNAFQENGAPSGEGVAEALAQICRIIGEVRELDGPADPDDRFDQDLGCTSFDMMVVLARIEGELGGELDFTRLDAVATPRDLANVWEG